MLPSYNFHELDSNPRSSPKIRWRRSGLPMNLRPGSTVGSCEVVAKIDEGGTGWVYRPGDNAQSPGPPEIG